MTLDAHFDGIQSQLNQLMDELHALESSPGASWEQVRVLRREKEQLQHRLLWRDKAHHFTGPKTPCP